MPDAPRFTKFEMGIYEMVRDSMAKGDSWQHTGNVKIEGCKIAPDPYEGKRKRYAPAILDEVKATMEERAKVYGDGCQEQVHAKVLATLFPGGLPATPEMVTLNMIIAKVIRYALAPGGRGHRDSAHDIIGYAAILESYHEPDET